MDTRDRRKVPKKKSPALRTGKPERMRSTKKRVTIADIARLAGVSPAAVSITLTDRRDVSLSESTRDRIRRCAETLGYFPNRLGEGFFHGRSKLIGVLILSDSYRPFLDCAAGIHESLAAADCFPLFMSPAWIEGHLHSDFAADPDRRGGLPELRRLLEYQVDGVLYYSTRAEHTADCIRELSARNIPIVVLGGADPSVGAVDIVGGDNEAVGRMAADHLLSVGCTSFVFGKPAACHPLDNAVQASFAARLRKAGRACREFTLDAENPGDLAALLSRLARPPAGVFCARDDIAALALRAAFSLGWRVPGDCAVMGMGESEYSWISVLPITVVERNAFMVGKTAAELLLRRIEGFAGAPQKILTQPSLAARASSQSDVSWLLEAGKSRRRAASRK